MFEFKIPEVQNLATMEPELQMATLAISSLERI
jgi:hypothetical protein